MAVKDSDEYTVSAGVAYYGKFVIEPKTITVTWSYAETIYNGTSQKPEPKLTAKELCSRNDIPDTVTVVAIVDDNDPSINVGKYTASAVLGGTHGSNYVIKEDVSTKEFEIKRATLTINWTNVALIYNGEAQLPTPNLKNEEIFSRDDVKDTVTAVAAIKEGTTPAINASSSKYIAVVTLSGTHSDNYQIKTGTGSTEFTIAKREITVTWTGPENFIYTYNSENQNPEPKTDDEVFNNDETVSLRTTTFTAAGNHRATASIYGEANSTKDNYTIKTGSTQAYTINKLTVSVLWDSTDTAFVYIGEAQYPGAEIRNDIFKNDDVKLVLKGNTQDKNLTVGTYKAKATLDGADSANFELEEAISHEYSITPATLTLDWTSGYNSTYTGAAKVPAPKIEGKYGSDMVTVVVTVDGGNDKAINVGTYYAEAVLAGNDQGNYVLDGTKAASYQITKCPITVTWANTTLTYNGRAQNPTPSVPNSSADNKTFNYDGNVSISASSSHINANEYVISAVISGDAKDNYEITSGSDTTFTINKRSVSIDWSKTTLTYTGTAQQPTPSISDNVFANDKANDKIDLYCNGTRTDAGVYQDAAEAYINGTAANNYSLNNTVCTSFEIKPASVEVDWGSTLTFIYNGQTQAPSATATGVSGESVALTISGGIAAGKYTATATSGNKNYTAISNTKEFTIDAKPVSVTWSNVNLIYDGYTQQPTAVANNGIITGDQVSISVSGGQINVGTYTATANSENKNYVVEGATATRSFTISPTKIESLGFVNVTYNGKAQAPSIDYAEGLKRNDTVDTLGLTFLNLQTTVGEELVTITINNENYVFDDGEIRSKDFRISYISKRAVSVSSWNNINLTYNGESQHPDPIFSDSVLSADIESEYVSVNVTGAQTTVGSYSATVSLGGDGANNYTLTSATTNYTISKADVTVTWSNTNNKIYNGNYQKPDVSLSGVFGSDDVTLVIAVGTSKNNANVIGVIDAGDYSAYASLAGDDAANYNIPTASASHKFTINKLAVTVSWSGGTEFIYNGSAQGPTASVNEPLFLAANLSVTYDKETNSGTYTASARMTGGNTATYSNFHLVNYEKTYTIEKAPITVTWSGTTETYNGGYQKPTATLSGVLLGDTVSTSVKVGTSSSNANASGAINAGNYYAYLTVSGESAGNYKLTGSNTSSTAFTISKLDVSVSWTSGTYTYNGQQQGPSASINNLVAADKNAGKVSITVSGLGTDAGNYTATASLSGSAKNNYTLSNTTKSYTIAKKTLTVNWSNLTQTYTGGTLKPTATLSGVVAGDTVSLTVTGATAVGTHTVTATLTGADAGNYQLSSSGATSVTNDNFVIKNKSSN